MDKSGYFDFLYKGRSLFPFFLSLLHANENNDDCELSMSVYFFFSFFALMNDKNQMNFVLISIESNKYLLFAIAILFGIPCVLTSFHLHSFLSRSSIPQVEQNSKLDLMKQSNITTQEMRFIFICKQTTTTF